MRRCVGGGRHRAAGAPVRRFSSLSELLPLDNFASGGLTVLAGGAALAAAKASVDYLKLFALRRCVVRAEFDSRDDSYRWVVAWLTEHPAFERRNTHFTVSTSLQRVGSTSITADPADPIRPPVLLVPIGAHYMWHRGRLFWFVREKKDDSMALNPTKDREALTLYSLGPSRAPVDRLIEDAREAYLAKEHARTCVYQNDEYGNWRLCSRRPPRPLGSVVLDSEATAPALLADVRDYMQGEDWYARRGIPYRRGYLLHGPPGTGKTSFVTALAGELRVPIYMVLLSSPRLTDEMLTEVLTSAAPRAILLLEDVDAVFAGRARQGGEGGQLSFAGLLNALDGVAAQEGRVVFLTTNHPDRLSSALIRPGRVDRKVYFGRCTKYQVTRFAQQFYEGAADGAAFAAAVPDGALSVAELQGLLMEHRDDPAAALRNVQAAVTRKELE
eukprot:TRINITY_DN22407_c0_g1_i1.p1 TRINITY_DN22407_c0_g1~~TRINITY_DN22407_c0_g1_i1.p1  ORF type:complete len:443 (+),score=146.49 TRINITY_DN22407_c0_g1_i1:39-1367(+)